MSGELQKVKKRAQTFKVPETYRTPRGIAPKRFVDKEQSPQCQIDMQGVPDHFKRTEDRSEDDLVQGNDNSIFHVDRVTKDRKEQEMESSTLNDKYILEEIKS
jgi:hypothetical protein